MGLFDFLTGGKFNNKTFSTFRSLQVSIGNVTVILGNLSWALYGIEYFYFNERFFFLIIFVN